MTPHCKLLCCETSLVGQTCMSEGIWFKSSYGSGRAVWYIAKSGRRIVQLGCGLRRWDRSSLVGRKAVSLRSGRWHSFFSWPLATCIDTSVQDHRQLCFTPPAERNKGVVGQPCRCQTAC